MTNTKLLTWLPLLGAFVWLSGGDLAGHPIYPIAAVLAVLVFSAFATPPNPN